jgi:hypothetical protein
MPIGHAAEGEAVYERSRFWGKIWYVGDAVYYFGIFSSIMFPLMLLSNEIRHFESWWRLLGMSGVAVILFVSCFPIGLRLSGLLQRLACRRTGVLP